jgi:hypothetical protein
MAKPYSHAVLAVYQPDGMSRNPSTVGLEKSTLCMCHGILHAENVRWYYGHLVGEHFINTGVLGIVQEEVYEHAGKYYLRDGSVVP